MSTRSNELTICDTPEQVYRQTAELFVQLANTNINKKDIFTVVLSGGSTPQGVYTLLGDPNDVYRNQVPWKKIHLFWGDERHVPPDNEDSNYRMVKDNLLSNLHFMPENIHRIHAENPDATRAAQNYESLLKNMFRLKKGEFPRFDLILLGMGSDGHTASLFPGNPALKESETLVAAPWIEQLGAYRVTLTLPVINNAENIIFLVTGGSKAETVRMVLQGQQVTDLLPAQLIQPVNGTLVWLIDKSAAARLLL